MKFNPDIHHRRSVRLKGFDYARPGAYFVTICTYKKEMYFEDSRLAQIARLVWDTIPDHHPIVRIDEFVVMPNHVHGIIWLSDGRRGRIYPAQITPTGQDPVYDAVNLGGTHPAPTKIKRTSLPVVVQNFKAEVTRQIRNRTRTYFAWQRNYHEHVVRTEDELNRIRQYIRDNPLNWETDEENPNSKTDV